ncbi:hypothetical protein Fmac_021081 [Flemingia macrophylla]|uniref:UBC core domain-containing protein n=1 Tax=Flemingia macrophylla TaxID=520843 RepID=A0ABD1LVZ3_9FABA
MESSDESIDSDEDRHISTILKRKTTPVSPKAPSSSPKKLKIVKRKTIEVSESVTEIKNPRPIIGDETGILYAIIAALFHPSDQWFNWNEELANWPKPLGIKEAQGNITHLFKNENKFLGSNLVDPNPSKFSSPVLNRSIFNQRLITFNTKPGACSLRTVSYMVADVANDSLNKKLKQEHISLGIDGRKAESSIQSHNLIINFDEHDSDESSCSFSDNDGSSDSSGLFWNDCMDVDEHFSKLQKKFYSVDFPVRIEPPILWMTDLDISLNVTNAISLPSLSQSQSGTKNSEEIVPSQHEHESQGPSTGPSENEMVSDNIPIDLPNVAPQKGPLVGQTPDTAHLQNLKDVSAGSTMGSRQSLFAGHSLGFPVAGGPSANLLGTNNAFPFRPFHTPNPISFGFGVHYAPPRNLFSPPIYEPDPISFAFGPDSFPQNLFPPPSYSPHPNSFGFGPHNLFPSPRVQKFSVWLPSSWYDDTTEIANTATAPMPDEARYEMLRKFQNFKQFDTAGDWSDHFFLSTVSMNQPPSAQWTEKIMEEWKILEKNLPGENQIFVRVSESRLDIMRAVMIGAEGTPYHNGLFFFDIKFPIEYPNVPPLVYYHSGGQSLNPNLYGCGTVCLSLLGTSAQGSVTEGWIPNVSTVLQVLVSIQGLIFTPEPYYNEPWTQVFPSASHTGARSLLNYNERTFLATLKTMAYIMRNPPKV